MIVGFKGGKLPPSFWTEVIWCDDYSCPLIGCMRNPKNITNPDDPHLFAGYRTSDECPITVLEQQADIAREECSR